MDSAWLGHVGLAPLSLLGRQPLPVFAAGAILSFAGYCALSFWPDAGWGRVVLVNAGGAAILLVVAALAQWQSGSHPQPVTLRPGPWLPFFLRPARRDGALP